MPMNTYPPYTNNDHNFPVKPDSRLPAALNLPETTKTAITPGTTMQRRSPSVLLPNANRSRPQRDVILDLLKEMVDERAKADSPVSTSQSRVSPLDVFPTSVVGSPILPVFDIKKELKVNGLPVCDVPPDMTGTSIRRTEPPMPSDTIRRSSQCPFRTLDDPFSEEVIDRKDEFDVGPSLSRSYSDNPTGEQAAADQDTSSNLSATYPSQFTLWSGSVETSPPPAHTSNDPNDTDRIRLQEQLSTARLTIIEQQHHLLRAKDQEIVDLKAELSRLQGKTVSTNPAQTEELRRMREKYRRSGVKLGNSRIPRRRPMRGDRDPSIDSDTEGEKGEGEERGRTRLRMVPIEAGRQKESEREKAKWEGAEGYMIRDFDSEISWNKRWWADAAKASYRKETGARKRHQKGGGQRDEARLKSKERGKQSQRRSQSPERRERGRERRIGLSSEEEEGELSDCTHAIAYDTYEPAGTAVWVDGVLFSGRFIAGDLEGSDRPLQTPYLGRSDTPNGGGRPGSIDTPSSLPSHPGSRSQSASEIDWMLWGAIDP